MADERINYEAPAPVEQSTDRGLFDFMKKKDEEGHKASEVDAVASGIEKVHVSEPECKEEEKKHGGLLEKLHRSDSSSSSSSDEEGDDEEKKKRRKEKKEKKAGLKEKLQEKLGGHKDSHEHDHDHDTNVPIEKVHVEEHGHVHSEPSYPAPADHHQQEEEKKGGFLDKIKEKLPGQHKEKSDEHEVVAPVAAPEPSAEGDKEKKGFLEKIKEKIPGFHSKNGAEEKKDHEEKKEGY